MIYRAKTRWLLITSACAESVLGIPMGMGLGFAVLAVFMIIGALIQPRFHHVGRGVICFGSILLTAFVIDIGVFTMTEWNGNSRVTPGLVYILLSVLFAIACDVAVVTEEIRMRRSERILKRGASTPTHAMNG